MKFDWITEALRSKSFHEAAITAVVIAVLCLISYFVVKRLLIKAIKVALNATKNIWDDILIEKGVFNSLAYLAPAVVLYYGATRFPSITSGVRRAVIVYVAVNIIFLVDKVLSSGIDIYETFEVSKARPIKGYVQVIKLLVYIFGGIVTIGLLLGQSPWGLLTGLGALTAVLLLIFRDTILSFIASIQIASYDIIRVGDWVEVPAYGADGDVIDLSLHTVKVQNFDKTIVTIPTHRLVTDSVKNWRGMSESGGRRIMRSVLLDQRSVRFLDDEMVAKLEKIQILKNYIKEKKEEITAYNEEHGVDPSVPVNGRRMTNIGTFRAYVIAYLRQHPKVTQDTIILVRQMAPTPTGLPIQIYVFAATTAWVDYEGIQGDIFDHILAAVPEFGLKVFQAPTGHDISELRAARLS